MAGPVPAGGRAALNRIGPLRRFVPRETVWLALGFTVLAAAVTWRAWTPNPLDRLWIGGAEGDFLRQFYPYRVFVARAIAGGHLPLWNPHQYAGTPALADPQMAVLYPWRLLQAPFAVGGDRLSVGWVTLEAIAHLVIGAVGATFLARAAGARGGSAIVAGIAFGSGGYLTGYPLDQLGVLESAVWVPVSLWGLVRAADAPTRRSRIRFALVAAGASALSLLAGHPQTAGFGVVAGVLYLLWRAGGGLAGRGSHATAGAPRDAADLLHNDARADDGDRSTGPGASVTSSSPGTDVRLGAIAIVWLLAAAGFSAVQWMPTASLARHAARTLTRDEILAGLPVLDLVQIVAPHAVSRWSPLYVGVATSVVALWAGWAVPRARGWLVLAAGGWLWSLGGHGPLVPIALRIAPGWMVFRHQERAAIIVSLGLAVAAAIGVDHIARSAAARRSAGRALGAVAAVLAVLALLGATGGPTPEIVAGAAGPWAWPDALAHGAIWAGAGAVVIRAVPDLGRPTRWLPVVLGIAMALDLLSANANHALGTVPSGEPYREDALVDALRPRARDGRVSSEGLLPGGANAASVHGLYDVTGDSPLHLATTAKLVEEAPEIAWWRLLGVRYVVTDREVGPAEAELLRQIAREGQRALYEVQLPVPLVWATYGTRCVEDDRGWRPTAGFDPLEAVVVHPFDTVLTWKGVPAEFSSFGRDLCAEDDRAADDRNEGSRPDARLTGLSPGRAEATVTLERPGWLVRSTSWDWARSWHVVARSDDGRAFEPAPVPAYFALPAVWLPAGHWTVQWTVRPATSILGAIVSMLTWSVVIVGTIWVRRQDRPGK